MTDALISICNRVYTLDKISIDLLFQALVRVGILKAS